MRPNVRHIGILFPVSAVDMSFYTSLRNFIQIGPLRQTYDVMSIFKVANLDFGGPIMVLFKTHVRLPIDRQYAYVICARRVARATSHIAPDRSDRGF